MRIILPILFFSLALVQTACSSTKKQADLTTTRNHANKAYSELDAETGSPHINQRDVRNGDIDRFSKNPNYSAKNSAVIFEGPKPTIMVLPAKSAKGSSELSVVTNNPMSKAMMEAINGYLTQKNFEVKSLEGETNLEDLIKMQNDIANTDDDMSYLASLSLGADIYIKFSGSVQQDNATVEVSAYETSTARLLGSQTAEVKNNGHTSQANLRANVQSAARKAMPNLEQKILNYWKNDLAKGCQYKVVMNLKGEYSDNQLEDIQDFVVRTLKQNFNSVSVNVMTEKTLDMVIYADPAKYSDSQEVYSQVRQLLKGTVESKKINLTRKLIIMDLR